MTEFIQSLCGGLTVWARIRHFIHKMVIIDVTKSLDEQLGQEMEYKSEIVRFNEDVILFYNHGSKSFLSKHDIGDKETFYMHTLRCYLPVIVNETWTRYHLGIRIFTMQGVEHRNKEVKNIFTSHTNKRGNQLVQCMHRLWNLFYFQM